MEVRTSIESNSVFFRKNPAADAILVEQGRPVGVCDLSGLAVVEKHVVNRDPKSNLPPKVKYWWETKDDHGKRVKLCSVAAVNSWAASQRLQNSYTPPSVDPVAALQVAPGVVQVDIHHNFVVSPPASKMSLKRGGVFTPPQHSLDTVHASKRAKGLQGKLH
jgi:hypothetical protein